MDKSPGLVYTQCIVNESYALSLLFLNITSDDVDQIQHLDWMLSTVASEKKNLGASLAPPPFNTHPVLL